MLKTSSTTGALLDIIKEQKDRISVLEDQNNFLLTTVDSLDQENFKLKKRLVKYGIPFSKERIEL